MNYVTSSQNPAVKEVKALKVRKHRDEKGLFFIEGIRFVDEAINEVVEINRVFISESFLDDNSSRDIIMELQKKGIGIFVLSNNIFKEISDTENPQGILAVVKAKQYELSEMVKGNALIIILDSIQDPGNLGTIIRTADASGATGVLLSKGCVDLYNPKVLRSTMGSIFHIPVCQNVDLEAAIEVLKHEGVSTYAAHLSGRVSYFELELKNKCAFIIGNEANGISCELLKEADNLVRIPMPGRAESLNASIAAGLLMYETVRQRYSKP